MPGIDYKVLEAKNFEAFSVRVIQEGAEGWRVISVAIRPHGYYYAVMGRKTGAYCEARISRQNGAAGQVEEVEMSSDSCTGSHTFSEPLRARR